jgi:thioredoxin 1
MQLSVDERTFTQEVLESSTPVLVNFWAPWCGLCRMINPLLSRFQAEWGEQVKLVGINADQSLKLSSTYRLTTLPTLLWFESGKVIHRIDSFHGRDDLQLALDQIARNYTQVRCEVSTSSGTQLPIS